MATKLLKLFRDAAQRFKDHVAEEGIDLRERLEGALTAEEKTRALHAGGNSKTPGASGLKCVHIRVMGDLYATAFLLGIELTILSTIGPSDFKRELIFQIPKPGQRRYLDVGSHPEDAHQPDQAFCSREGKTGLDQDYSTDGGGIR